MIGVQAEELLIGYSVYDRFEECWLYNENSCFIAGTKAAAGEFLACDWADPADCRIEAVSLKQLREDFGCSGGEFAMESAAFERFRVLAEQSGVPFEHVPYDGDKTLQVVTIRHDHLRLREDVE